MTIIAAILLAIVFIDALIRHHDELDRITREGLAQIDSERTER